MKAITSLFFIFALSIIVFGQTTKPKQPPLQNTNQTDNAAITLAKITNLQEQKKAEENKIKLLLVKYTEDYSEIVQAKVKIANIDKQISELSKLTSESASTGNKGASLLLEILALRSQLKLCGYSSSSAGCSDGENKRKLAIAYQQAVKFPEVMNVLIGDAIEKFDGSRDQTKSAMQVSQIADEQNAELIRIIVAQNQRIIELLEKLAKGK